MKGKRMARLISGALCLCTGLLFAGCSGGGGGGGGGGGPAAQGSTELLWSADRLTQEMAKDQDLLILDCRQKEANPGPAAKKNIISGNDILTGELYRP